MQLSVKENEVSPGGGGGGGGTILFAPSADVSAGALRATQQFVCPRISSCCEVITKKMKETRCNVSSDMMSICKDQYDAAVLLVYVLYMYAPTTGSNAVRLSIVRGANISLEMEATSRR